MFLNPSDYPFPMYARLAQLSVVEKVAIRKGTSAGGTMPARNILHRLIPSLSLHSKKGGLDLTDVGRLVGRPTASNS
jgi:hypothetical protein